MASFRSQQGTTYTSNGNEQTVQTGETLGKALQSVRNPNRKMNEENELFSLDLSKRSSIFFDTINSCLSTTIEW
jgi:hypothetical protein